MVHIAKAVKDTLEKSTLSELRDFVKIVDKSAIWYLVSDYCFDDKDKVSDTVTFSLIINHDKLTNIKEYIKTFQPCDIKSTSEVRAEFLKYVVSPVVYNFTFVLDKADKFLANSFPNDEVIHFMEFVDDNIQHWTLDNPLASKYIQDFKKRISIFREEKKAKTFNWKLMRKILIISSIASVIMYEVEKLNNAIAIKWVSDRDGIAERFDSIAFDLAFISYVLLLSDFGSVPVVDLSSMPKLLFVTSKKGTDDDYDELVRIPDFIAGTVASIKDVNSEFKNIKYYPVYFGTIVNASNHTIIAIGDQNNDLYIRRMIYRIPDLNETAKWDKISNLISDNTVSKQVNKGINNADHVMYMVHKDDVLLCDFTGINDIIERLSQNSDALIKNKGCLEVFISGFDDDPREVFTVPEVRRWYAESIKAGIPWFYFLSNNNNGMSLLVFLFSCCDIEVKQKDGKAYVEITNPECIVEWLTQNYHNLNIFTDTNNIPNKYNEEMSLQVMATVNSYLSNKSGTNGTGC